MVAFWLPAESSGEIVPLDNLEAVPVVSAIAYWRRLCDGRAFPAKADIEPREIAFLLGNLILVRVLSDGDYEYRMVGEALVPAFSENFSGRRLSAIIAQAPKFGLALRMLYETVRTTGMPLGFRGRVGQDMKGADFAYHENALLPLGPEGGGIDHLLIVSVIVTGDPPA